MNKVKLLSLVLLVGAGSLIGCSSGKELSQSTKNNLKEIYRKWVAGDYAKQSNLLEEYWDLKKGGASPQEFKKARDNIFLYYSNIQLWQSKIKEMSK